MITTSDIAAAAERLAPHVRRTELFVSEPMAERVGSTIVVKAEHGQLTGSFKLRGALNAALGIDDDVAERGIVTASSGNHGIAVATAASLAEVPCTVYLPTGASPAKVDAIKRRGATIVTIDSTDAYRAEARARADAEGGRFYLSPYNDPAVIAGQGTVGVELLADLPALGLERLDAVVVAVGGGGLVSGIATWLAEHAPDTMVLGASPANDAAMLASIQAGKIVEPTASPTFSDGTAGGIEPGSITFELCRSLVDEWVAVSEAEIARAVVDLIDDHQQLVEGAAGVALAAATTWGRANPGSVVAVVTCGANVDAATLEELLVAARTSRG
ncbi:MAG: pyridoxal-phosphate dependent enzyme [Acidimicrobiia bacterium]|nr:pyridoxal-phosphate dependent enzyme [Acidimicrobiia bacterium]